MAIDLAREMKTLKLSPGPRAVLEVLSALLSGGAGDVPADSLRAAVAEKAGGALTDAAFRQRLSRLNAELTAAGAAFEVRSAKGRIALRRNARFDEKAARAELEGKLESRMDDATARVKDATVTPYARPAGADELWVMVSYAWQRGSTVRDDLHRCQLDFIQELTQVLAYPPPAHADLPPIKLWRDAERLTNDDQGDPQMENACLRAFLGLLVMSDKYPASPYCSREAAHFLTDTGANQPGKRCLVVPLNVQPRDVPERFSAGSRVWLLDDRDRTLAEHWGDDAHRRHGFVRRVADQIWTAARAHLSARVGGDRVEALAARLADRTDSQKAVPPRAAPARLSGEFKSRGR